MGATIFRSRFSAHVSFEMFFKVVFDVKAFATEVTVETMLIGMCPEILLKKLRDVLASCCVIVNHPLT